MQQFPIDHNLCNYPSLIIPEVPYFGQNLTVSMLLNLNVLFANFWELHNHVTAEVGEGFLILCNIPHQTTENCDHKGLA